ncbi:MAG TPA: SUMF1/EgtB/PvdO family nonheme iron enzyme [Pirellulales bacterium]|nr:SUMF1/EgtB/PvdO family nonheme iron enzyme [Pirellulales bacterium]
MVQSVEGRAPSPGNAQSVEGRAPSPGNAQSMEGRAPSPGNAQSMEGRAPSPGNVVEGRAPSPGNAITRMLCFAACGWFWIAGWAAAADRALPPAAKIEAAKKLVAETFAKELSQSDKAPAVKAMLELAEKTTGDAPSQAALYLSAAEIAARIGDTRLAFDAVDQLARAFDVDELAAKGTLLDLAAGSAKTNEARMSVANRGLELADAAVSAGKFDLAESALKAAAGASAKLRDANLRKEIAAKRRSVEKARKQASRVESEIADARKKLAANPDDSAANESLGKHLAFDLGDWAAGLKHLAKGKDSQLRAVAVVDRSADGDSAAMAKAGDLWWSLAESAADARDKLGYQSRAVFWYTRAAVGLSGLAKARLEKRISEAGEAALSAAAAQNGGDNGKFLDITLAPGVLMRLVKIPASKDGKVKEFWLGQTEVTQKQWAAVMGGPIPMPQNMMMPAVSISQNDCEQFMDLLSSRTAGQRRLVFRFPSAGEFDHAFLAGETFSYFRSRAADYGWHAENTGSKAGPRSVMSLRSNGWGLYDMLGNVWEICSDGTIRGGCVGDSKFEFRGFRA